MSRSRYYEINCDAPESERSRDCWEQVGPERTMAALLKDARKSGWKVGPVHAEQDRCPECRKHS